MVLLRRKQEGLTVAEATEQCTRLLLTSSKPTTHLQKGRCVAACRTWTLVNDDRSKFIDTVKFLLSRLSDKVTEPRIFN